LRGSGESIPLYRIDRKGRGEQVATLDPIYPAGCALRYEQPLEWPLALEMRDGWFPGLPYPLDDKRPQGSRRIGLSPPPGHDAARPCADR
jgi:hypothetical protein